LRPSAQAFISVCSQTGLLSYSAFMWSGSMKSFIRRSRYTADSPSASARRPIELRKLVSTRLKSSSACAYIRPNTASASVFPWTWGMPQLSRVMVTRCACCSQAVTAGVGLDCGANAVHTMARTRTIFFMARYSATRGVQMQGSMSGPASAGGIEPHGTARARPPSGRGTSGPSPSTAASTRPRRATRGG